MFFQQVVLNTDILLSIMRKNPVAISKARSYLNVHRKFTISIITHYEILRGLKAKGAAKQLMNFDEFCKKSLILPLTDEIIVKADDIYAKLRRSDKMISDADALIAASAMINRLGVVTNNECYFRQIEGLEVGNWLK